MWSSSMGNPLLNGILETSTAGSLHLYMDRTLRGDPPPEVACNSPTLEDAATVLDVSTPCCHLSHLCVSKSSLYCCHCMLLKGCCLQVNDDEELRSPDAQDAVKSVVFAPLCAAGGTLILLLLGFLLLTLAPTKVNLLLQACM